MLKRTLTALAAVTLTALPCMASAQQLPPMSAQNPGSSLTDANPAGVTRGNRPSRMRDRAREAAAAPAAAPTPEELVASAQSVATAAGATCQVTEAISPGFIGEGQPVYEAVCATGPGYILISSTPPQAVDCVILAGQADIDRTRDPAAVSGTVCTLPANTDVAKVVRAYAQDAGISCTVDQGASVGKSTAGNVIYEVGCSGADGYWIEKTPGGWDRTGCLQVVSQSAECRFTTTEEQAATVKALLAGSPAASCDVTRARFMGSNANGAFYEASCVSGGGFVARVNEDMAVEQTYPCAEASRIGGGCTLTAGVETRAAPVAHGSDSATSAN